MEINGGKLYLDDPDDVFDVGLEKNFDTLLFGQNQPLQEEEKATTDSNTIKTNNEKIDPNEKSLVKGTRPFMMFIVGRPGEGKSALAQYVVWDKFHKKQIDYILLVTSTPWNDDWSFIPKKAKKGEWNDELLAKIKKVQTQNERGHLCIVLEDQAGAFPWDDKNFTNLLISHRHYNTSIIINMQYVNKVPPIVRECSSHVAIFHQYTDRSRQALYDSFGGSFLNKEEFYKTLNENTEERYYFMYYEAALFQWSRCKITPIETKGQVLKY